MVGQTAVVVRARTVEPKQIVLLRQVAKSLATITKLGDVKDIRDKAEAIRSYAKQQRYGLQAQNDAAEIKIRAERRGGELLLEMKANKQRHSGKGNNQKLESHDAIPKLKDLGVNLSESSRWQKVATLSEKRFEAFIEETRASEKELTTHAVLQEQRASVKADRKAEQIESVKSASLPSGKFHVIVADPPWCYESRAEDSTHRAANPYPSMSIDSIKSIGVTGLAHDNCILWLWTTNAFMVQAHEVAKAWGFEVKTILTWAKDRMGTGDWLRGQTEHCLMAVCGKPVVELTNQTTLLHGPMREHSRKPDEFYALVDVLCPGRKLELFSRQDRKGWTACGAEVGKFAA